ncbi:polysaccharide deacetylase family protein [Methylomicrobium agile]|uniref:polysaccharide deacetylase family protein n=1 Tax=Methylomicrobium agile TaxID=39774 RepID=UPI0004DFA062|nr:polysaccharide deacetylase family protein [Methylomicrobium agile]
MSKPLPIVLRCGDALQPKVRYVFDTLFMARGIPVAYYDTPPVEGPWILYGDAIEASRLPDGCLAAAHCPNAWRLFEGTDDVDSADPNDGLPLVFPQRAANLEMPHIPFDLAANAFYFLSSWTERRTRKAEQTRRLYPDSAFARLEIPQDIVDRYLETLDGSLQQVCERLGRIDWRRSVWPKGASYALVLSHDVDFVPYGFWDIAKQGAKTVLRHLVRQRDPKDAVLAAKGLGLALLHRQDPYGCVPEIIAREKKLRVRSSFQVAVARRHPVDVNYRIEDDPIRDYLRTILEAGFDLCLHGSYSSTEHPDRYLEEAALLTRRLARPLGSRQHFLSFDYDTLFTAQERAGILYDMSMGFPDRSGPRTGFSHPYFPYCLPDDRPYNVLQIGLFLMDVTLRSYQGLKGEAAWRAIRHTLDGLQRKGGCASAVWHPIVFGGARDPGYDRLYWDMIRYTHETGGLATDGRTVNEFWRRRAQAYASFNRTFRPPVPHLDAASAIPQGG